MTHHCAGGRDISPKITWQQVAVSPSTEGEGARSLGTRRYFGTRVDLSGWRFVAPREYTEPIRGKRAAMKPLQSFGIYVLLGVISSSVSASDEGRPMRLLWGDTHVHTYLSGDAYGMGNRTTPDEAYRFAQGEAVTATGGATAQLKRPLDFIVITDHAENLGVLPMVMSGDQRLLDSPGGQATEDILQATPPLSEVLAAPDLETFTLMMGQIMTGKAAWGAVTSVDPEIRREIWHQVIANAERYNNPGKFTALIGYEYSSSGPMLHRNVIFRDGPEKTRLTVPFSRDDSRDPEELWQFLDQYRQQTGGDVISIPHNSNLSTGNSFRPRTFDGAALTPAYARLRADLEPVAEVTQIKGDSETHPLISPEDEFADYETWWQPPTKVPSGVSKGAKSSKDVSAKPKQPSTVKSDVKKVAKDVHAGVAGPSNTSIENLGRQSHVRSGLRIGLELEQSLGTNPFKLGMIGSTDSHSGLASADDDNFWGKMAIQEPSPFRMLTLSNFDASGYAAVWAEDNTREAIFAALRRREVYATTGPRILLRFFGGYEFTSRDVRRGDLAQNGYSKGVPMGSDLVPSDQAPSFLIHAARDPDGAKLDRVQVVKGWLDDQGVTHEQVFDAIWAGRREPDASGSLPVLRSTVDVDKGTYRNRVGASSLTTLWQDPDFDPKQPAFYYVRVLQIKTPRWTAIDAARYGVPFPAGMNPETQERAYSSPIWYPGQPDQ
ncbi:MAG: hypothetical protein CMQ05_11230 [Gammaproteobacteria bacterium]|nr:hypothetical protein [Gammaproteobacteria bacterium]